MSGGGRCRKGCGIRKAQSCFVYVHEQVGKVSMMCVVWRGVCPLQFTARWRAYYIIYACPPRPLSPTSRLRERLLESLSAKGKVTFRE